jgi:hypothetical protein
MIGFRRDGDDVVAVLQENEAQVIGLVVAQVAGLIELSRTETAEDPELGANIDAELDELGELDELDELADLDDDDLPHHIEPDRTRVDHGLDLGFSLTGPPPPDGADAHCPDDPVLARLFPDGYRDDPEASAELRSMIQGDLHTQKLDHANTMLATLPLTGGEIRLDTGQAESWLLALNDARLALGTRLDVTDEMDILDELDEAVLSDPTGPRVLALGVYHLLGYAQETLIDALAG